MEVLTAMIGKVVELALVPSWRTIKRQYDYAFNYNVNVDDLINQVEKLKNARDRVQHSVDCATRQLEEIEADVRQWLTRVSAILEESSKFLEDAEEEKKKSCLGFYPNLKSRYGVGKNSQKRAELVVKCYGEGNFPRVSYPAAPRGIGDRSPRDYEAFESRMPILNAIVEALKDPDVDLVGVYGMPGVGKTTLVKKIAGQVKAVGMFDAVVLAFVSQTPNLRKIQGEIADGLDFKLDAESDSGRADKLLERLKKEKTLVILDDIWEELKLEDVGIPVGREELKLEDVGIPAGRDHGGCKILMTSRNRKVLSHQMGAKETFMLPVLIENEAWNLFEKMAGHVVNKNPTFHSVATEVAKRCGGLPILLVTVARALKDGDLSDWKDALGQLQRIDNDEMDAQVYKALELSFNHLKDDEVKSLFLLCGQLIPNIIWILDLLKYVMGLGLFKQSNTLEEARNRLYKLINDLCSKLLVYC